MPSDSNSSLPTAGPPVEERVLLLISEKTDAKEIVSTLRAIDVWVESFTTLSPLNDALQDGAGAIIVEEEAITRAAVRLLSSAMSKREAWSNLPILILTRGDPEAIERLDRLSLFGPATASNVTILERPVHEVTLTTTVRSALRARRRQYEVRDLMDNLESKNEQLRESQAALQEANETLEERVEARTRQVRRLALNLTTAEQQERKRISQLLHDHLQQLLHGARIWATSLADDCNGSTPEALVRIRELLEEATEATRTLAVELSPPMLEEEGLASALDWLSTHVAKTHDLQLTLNIPSDLGVSEEDLRTLLFRSIRELVFNVVKHAEVDTAVLQAEREADHLTIEVRDEGVGFRPDDLNDDNDDEAHFGLFSVRKRLDLVGGKFSIDAAPGEGTCARIDVPISE